MKNLQDKTSINHTRGTRSLLFDLEADYTVCFISRLLRVSKKMALRYVDAHGNLTQRGIQVMHDLNEEMIEPKTF
jgi:hypothetical protein